MSETQHNFPENLGNGNFQVPDTTGGQQVPEPEQKDDPERPGPLIGPAGF